MVDETRYSARNRARGGAAAGLLAGLVMALVAMIRSAAAEMGFWLPLQQIAGVVYGVNSLIASPGSVWVGFLIHMATSACWGLVFGLILNPSSTNRGALVKGVFYGLVVWLVMTWLVLPWANETMAVRVDMISGWWLGYHLIYGSMLFLTPTFVHSFAAPSSLAQPAARQQN